MVVRLLRSTLHRLGYETKKLDRRFTVAGYTYAPDTCSVGLTPQGELTGRAAIDMIRESDRRDLRILDMCCGEGIIGLTIFSECQVQIKELHFADINIFNLNSVQRTFGLNGLAPLAQEGRLKTWLTDSLNNMPAQPFDIIVSNPPHIFRAEFQSDKLNPGTLGTYDADWLFHRDFYAHCHKYLSDSGEVWFLENKAGATPETFMGYIRANPDLLYVRDFTEPREPGFFWMITKRS